MNAQERLKQAVRDLLVGNKHRTGWALSFTERPPTPLAHSARLTYWTIDERAALPRIVEAQVRYQRKKEKRRKGARRG